MDMIDAIPTVTFADRLRLARRHAQVEQSEIADLQIGRAHV